MENLCSRKMWYSILNYLQFYDGILISSSLFMIEESGNTMIYTITYTYIL